MRRIFHLAAIALAGYLAACGGGGTTITPPPPAGNFSNASLNGQYAFSMSGVDLNSGAYIARVGSFAADGQGHITAGLEDVLDLGSGLPASQLTFSNGTYQIQANGRGLIVLNVSGGGALQLSASLQSSSQGYLVQTDGLASTSGSVELQKPLQFSANAILGKYVFDLAGISFAGTTPSVISFVGEFGADGNGNVTGGTADVNDSALAPTGATALTASTYQLDTNGNGTNFGRGTMTLDGRAFAFYIVDNTRVELLEEDSLGGSSGPAILQTGVIPTQNSGFSGSFAFLTGGSQTTGNFGPIARVGRFTADGAGGIGTISFFENNDGNTTQVTQGSGISSTSYAIDTSNAGSGRGTFTFHNSSVGTVTYVFYLSSPTRAVIQDVSAGVVTDGTMVSQSAPSFTTASLAGNYSFSWSGVELVSPSAFDENYVGQYAQTSAATSNIAGVADYAQLGLNTINTNGVTLNAGISGTLTIAGTGTQNNTYKIVIGGPSAFTVNFVAYLGDNGTVLVVCSDGNRTTAGVASPQTQ
ncbi:MAG TPA: hypothetical protein VNU20_09075 [Candidatus Sulfotelmatobacter sp.]|jgi:hypothetical protein|nr:hypothetical protein [Candidatus Sulfotelmatobacter sp.]